MKAKKTIRRPYEVFGRKIAALLKERGLRQADLVRLTGIGPDVISRTIRGTRAPSRETLQGLCAALEVEPAELGYPHLGDQQHEVAVLKAQLRTAERRTKELARELEDLRRLGHSILEAMTKLEHTAAVARADVARAWERYR